jgi:hypothetical protein
MEVFARTELRLNKNVDKNAQESLLTLFGVAERFSKMEVLCSRDEDDEVRVVLEGLGEAILKLGDDMEKGQKKTIMTLFWFSERAKLLPMQRDAKAGESVVVTLWSE